MIGKILVIGSDSYENGLLKKIFSEKFVLHFCRYAEESMDVCKSFRPDTILYDMVIPDLELLKNVMSCRKPFNYEIPVVVIVSDNSLQFERLARQHKVSYYMIRPYDFRELEEALESCVKYSIKNSESIICGCEQ